MVMGIAPVVIVPIASALYATLEKNKSLLLFYEGSKFTLAISLPVVSALFFYADSIIGKWIHAPLYLPIQSFCRKKAGNSDHYDSVLVGILFVFYPIYLTLFALIIFLTAGGWFCLSAYFLLPFLAWSYIQVKKDF
jgi:hypothetical protein